MAFLRKVHVLWKCPRQPFFIPRTILKIPPFSGQVRFWIMCLVVTKRSENKQQARKYEKHMYIYMMWIHTAMWRVCRLKKRKRELIKNSVRSRIFGSGSSRPSLFQPKKGRRPWPTNYAYIKRYAAYFSLFQPRLDPNMRYKGNMKRIVISALFTFHSLVALCWQKCFSFFFLLRMPR